MLKWDFQIAHVFQKQIVQLQDVLSKNRRSFNPSLLGSDVKIDDILREFIWLPGIDGENRCCNLS